MLSSLAFHDYREQAFASDGVPKLHRTNVPPPRIHLRIQDNVAK